MSAPIEGTTTEPAGAASGVALAPAAPVEAAGLGVVAAAEAGCWLEVAGLLQAASAAARMRPLPVRSAARVEMGMVVGILEAVEGAGMEPGSGNPSYATMAATDEKALAAAERVGGSEAIVRGGEALEGRDDSFGSAQAGGSLEWTDRVRRT